MGFQPEYGQLLVREFSCEADMPYYCFVTRGKKDNTVKIAADDSIEVLGVSVPAAESFQTSHEGVTQKRNGYTKDEYPAVLHTGVCYILLGEDMEAGTLAMPDKEGKAINVKDVAFDSRQKIGGTIIDTGKKDDIVRIDLDRR